MAKVEVVLDMNYQPSDTELFLESRLKEMGIVLPQSQYFGKGEIERNYTESDDKLLKDNLMNEVYDGKRPIVEGISVEYHRSLKYDGPADTLLSSDEPYSAIEKALLSVTGEEREFIGFSIPNIKDRCLDQISLCLPDSQRKDYIPAEICVITRSQITRDYTNNYFLPNVDGRKRRWSHESERAKSKVINKIYKSRVLAIEDIIQFISSLNSKN